MWVVQKGRPTEHRPTASITPARRGVIANYLASNAGRRSGVTGIVYQFMNARADILHVAVFFGAHTACFRRV
jgi:hypothetical protein